MAAHATGANPFADTEDQAALRQLARDVAERELAPMARHGDETEEFPQWAWDGMRKAEATDLAMIHRFMASAYAEKDKFDEALVECDTAIKMATEVGKVFDRWRKARILATAERYAAAVTSVSAPGADGHRTFSVTLTPKPGKRASGDADFTLTLKASTKDFFPYDASLRVGRAGIRSTFENVRINPGFASETFHFSPPADADVFAAPPQS